MPVDSYFSENSMLRRVQGERALMLSGPRALLMQAAHPLAVEGLLAHTDGIDAPYERLARTAEVMTAIGFGTRAEADRLTRRVRAMHRRVRGRLDREVGIYPAGTPYAADDPELLMWVLFTLVDSGIVVYERFVGAMSGEQREDYWADFRVIGGLFGLEPEQMPADIAELDDYRALMYASGRLHVGDWARTKAREIVLQPPVPIHLRPLLEAVNFLTVDLLPGPIRAQYGFAPIPPPPIRALAVTATSEYLKRIVLPLLPASLRQIPAARAAPA
ncbi:MAG: oxygenase MpaB family protein [Solirubrobacterales bacterium]